MGKNYKTMPGLMDYYFSSEYDTNHTTADKVLTRIQNGFLEGKLLRIPNNDINRTREDITQKKKKLDESTHLFSQHLYHHIFGNKKRRVILLVDGTFYGDQNIETVLPIDLTKERYRVFKSSGTYDTIDESVSCESVNKFLSDNKDCFKKEGLDHFKIKSSRFFYLNEDEIKGFMNDQGDINLIKLVPYLSSTEGYVVLDQVETPSKEGFHEQGFPFLSHRLKYSLADKIVKRLNQSKLITITDWVGNRLILPSEEEVREMTKFLESSPTIDYRGKRTKIKHLSTSNYYNDPKKSTYRGMNIAIETKSTGGPEVVREIQLFHIMQYYHNYIDPKSPANHDNFKGNQKRLSKKKKTLNEHFLEIIKSLFNNDDERWRIQMI